MLRIKRIIPLLLLLVICANPIFAQQNSTRAVGIGWSHDAEYLAIGYSDRTAEIWHVNSNQLIHTLEGYFTGVTKLEWSPDGSKLATAAGYRVYIWDTSTWQLLNTLEEFIASDGVSSLEWSLDSRYLFINHSSGSESFNVWDTISQQTIFSGRFGTAEDLAFNSNGSRFAIPTIIGRINIIENGTFETITVLDQESIIENGLVLVSGYTGRITWSPSNSLIVTDTLDPQVFIWDAVRYELLFQLSVPVLDPEKPANPVFVLWFNPDESNLSTITSEGLYHIWSTTTGELIAESMLVGAPFTDVEISPNHTKIATVSASGVVETNTLPIAQATATQDTQSNTVFLDATGSNDPDGSIVSYRWLQGGLEVANGVSASIDNVPIGLQTYTLIVTDDDGASASFDVSIDVRETNAVPTVSATIQGGDTVVHTDTESAMANLQGSGSDTDGTIISYEWTNNGAVIATEANPQVTLSAGVHTLMLTVTDDDGAMASDDVMVTVNRLPVPEITAFQIAWTRNVELIGNASTDPDGSIVSYQWLQNGVEIATVEDPGIIENVPLGSHTYTLIVQDDKGGEVSVDAIVEVVNHNPVAVANYTVDMRQMECPPGSMFCFSLMFIPYLTLDASGSSDSDGTIDQYIWYRNGVQIAGQDTSTPGHEIIALSGLIASKITLTVIDNDGGQSGDEFYYPVDDCGCPVGHDGCLNMGCLD